MRGRSGTGFVLDEHGAQALARDIRQLLVKDDGYVRSRSYRLLSGDARLIDFLLIGGGLTSATAAETLRAAGAEGSIAILCPENTLPYYRPPLWSFFSRVPTKLKF
jgi:hypothetical protein